MALISRQRSRPVIEEFEPRILYSGDGAVLFNPHLLAPSAEVRLLDTIEVTEPVHEQTHPAEQQRHEIVFIDYRVPDATHLANELMQQRGGERTYDVVILNGDDDGVAQISRVLTNEHDLTAIHIISHGSDGAIEIGKTHLDVASLAVDAEAVARWGQALSADGDLLLYGCNVAQDAVGQAFVQSLARLTRADVAASSNLTGSASLGGDWGLEYSTGAIHSQLTVRSFERLQWAGVLTTYTVNSTADTNTGIGTTGTLRWVIGQTNANAGTDTINFNIAGGGVQTIAVTSALPTITGAVVIDGWTQPTYVGAPMIELNGAGAGANVTGLTLGAGSAGSTIRGLVINRFSNEGIEIVSNSNVVVGNYIGTDATGMSKLGNANDGIEIANGSNNTIGGTSVTARNIISGNGLGIRMAGSSTSGNNILGNYIGADATGAANLGNTLHGVFFSSINIAGATIGDPHDNRVGGISAGEGNLIVNNGAGGGGWDGVSLRNSPGIIGNAILGNSIYANGDLGIDLKNDGVTANDANDVDGGPNNLQNFPVLTSAQMTASNQFNVVGTLNSTANSFFRLEFFSSAAADGTGFGEAQQFLGSVNVTTDGSGNVSFNTTLSASVAKGSFISAAATASNSTFTTFTDTSELALNVISINAAPTLDNTKSPTLALQNEDAGAPSGAVGTLVSSLVDFASPIGQVDNVTDPDAGALLGIAVTATDTTQGTWWYSTNNGTNWNLIGAVADNNALLLAADATTRLYLQSNANYSGSLASAITFRAWDQTSGTAASTANTSTVTNTTLDQFSTAAYTNNDGTTTWAGPWIETDGKGGGAVSGDLMVTGGALQINASKNNDLINRLVNTAGATTATLSFSYDNQLIGTDTIVAQVSNNGGGSYTTLATFSAGSNFGTGSKSIDISAFIASNTQVQFAVTNGGGKSVLFLDNVQVLYGASNNGGSSAFSTATDTASLVINPVADTPSVTNATTNEDTQSTSGLVISRNAADGAEVTNFKITGITNGTLYLNDGTTAISNGSFISFVQGNAGLKFTPTTDFNGSGSFTVQASTSNADAGLGGSTVNATITVNAVNDAPTRTAGTVANLAVLVDSGLTSLGFGGLAYSPGGGADESAQTLSYAVTAVPSSSIGNVFLADGTTQVALGAYTLGQIQGMQFKTTTNGSGVTAFQYNVTDTGGTANAGSDNISEFVLITVTAVNDAPTATNLSAGETYTDDTALNLTDIVVSDVDSANVTATLTLSNVGAGSLNT